MFADYRVPQILATLGCISYSPPLGTAIQEKVIIKSGSKWELQLRGEFSYLFCFASQATPFRANKNHSLQHLVY